MYTYTSPSWTLPSSHPSRLSQSTELSSVCYMGAPHWLSILYMVVYTCQSQSPFYYSVPLNYVPLFLTPWTIAYQAPLSSTNSQSLLRFMAIKLVTLSNYLLLCCPILFLPSIFPSIRVFSNESSLSIRWTKYWSFSFSDSPSNEYSRLISFRIDWFDLLAVQQTTCYPFFRASLITQLVKNLPAMQETPV